MQRIKLPLPVLFISFLFLTGCQKETSTKEDATTLLEGKTAASSVGRLKERMAESKTAVSADFAQKLEQYLAANSTLKTEPWNKFRLKINATTTAPCDENTPFRQWLTREMSDWSQADEDLVVQLNLWSLVFGYTYLFESKTASQYFGFDGEFTQKLQKAFKDLRRFWGFQSIEVQMVALHGSILLDVDKIAALLRLDGRSDAQEYAEFIANIVKSNPVYRKGNHPYFTDNAIAFFENENSLIGPLPYKILIGDGMLEAFAALGYGDVAPQAILGHEFGHIIEFSLNIYANVPDAEVTRRFELLADAFSAYYLSHARGAAMQWKRVKQFLPVFFNIGDCQVEVTGHHGTPAQRMAAAEWAYNLANNAQKQGHIISAEEFVTRFDTALPEILSH